MAIGAGVSDVTPAFLDVRGRRTQILRRGSGRPVLYLHSAMGETWWTDLDEDLARDHDVIHPALPGFEESEGLAEIEDIQDLAFHVVDLLDALELERASIVGSSLGGWLAAEVAVLAPERVEALVLAGAAGIAPPVYDLFSQNPAELSKRLFADPGHWMAQLLSAVDLSRPAAVEILMPLLQAMEAVARVGWAPYMHDPKLERRLYRVTAPTLVVWGAGDGLIPVEQGRRYVELIEGARLEVLDGCGHLPVLERPEILAVLVRSHLARV